MCLKSLYLAIDYQLFMQARILVNTLIVLLCNIFYFYRKYNSIFFRLLVGEGWDPLSSSRIKKITDQLDLGILVGYIFAFCGEKKIIYRNHRPLFVYFDLTPVKIIFIVVLHTWLWILLVLEYYRTFIVIDSRFGMILK